MYTHIIHIVICIICILYIYILYLMFWFYSYISDKFIWLKKTKLLFPRVCKCASLFFKWNASSPVNDLFCCFTDISHVTPNTVLVSLSYTLHWPIQTIFCITDQIISLHLCTRLHFIWQCLWHASLHCFK